MAEKRCFAKSIIDSDAFLDMPLTTQALYFHLSMRADDDGFINSPKKIMRMIGASEDEMRLLVTKKFVLPFENGVVVIKHWRIHNCIRKDMYHETNYKQLKERLVIKESGAYSLSDGNQQQLICSQPITVQVRNEPVTDTVRVRTETEPNTEQVRTLNKYNINKDKLNKDIQSDKSDENDQKTALYRAIIQYLNEKAGTAYRVSSSKTRACISARLNEGFSETDFRTVIDKKCAEWLHDDRMAQYLRPQTLFGTKFEGYLNQKGGASNGHISTDSIRVDDRYTV